MKLCVGSPGQKSTQNYRELTNLIEQSQGLQLRLGFPQLMEHCCGVGQSRKALEVYLEGLFQVLKSCLRLALVRWEEVHVTRTSC